MSVLVVFLLSGRTENRMSITITPLSPERLGITGGVEMELRVPFDLSLIHI